MARIPGVMKHAALAGMLAWAGSAMADEAKKSTAEPVETGEQSTEWAVLDEFFILGSKEMLFELPGSAFYVDRSEIDTFNYSDINQVLRQVPGAYVREEDGYGLFPNISLRGVDTNRSSKVTMMEDGVLSSPAPYADPAAYYSPSTARMHGIEVLKGSSQVRYGPQTTGGVINYLSTPVPTSRSAYFRGSYGSYGEVKLQGYVGDVIQVEDVGTFGVLLELFRHQADGFRTVNASPQYPGSKETGFDKTDYMLKLNFRPDWNKPNYFEFKLGYTDFNHQDGYLGLDEADFRANPYQVYSGGRFDNMKAYQTRLMLRHVIDLDDNIQLATTGYYNQFDRNWYKLNEVREAGVVRSLSLATMRGQPGHGVLTGTAAGDLIYRANNRSYYAWGIQQHLDAQLETGSLEHEIELGWRYHQDQSKRFQHDDQYAQNAGGAITGVTPGAPGSQDNREERAKALALYAQDRISYDRLSVIPGIRAEFIDYSFDNFRTGASGSRNMNVLGGGSGVEYRLTPAVQLFGGYYRGFAIPSPGNAAGPNQLKEETSDAFEAGVRYKHEDGWLFGEVVGFYTLFDNLIGNFSAGGGVTVSANLGKATSRGVEVLVGVDPATYARQNFRTPISFAFTYTDAYLQSFTAPGTDVFSGAVPGNRIPYVPEFQFNLTGGIEYAKWGFFTSVTYVDKTFTSASNATGPVNPTGAPDNRFGMTDSFVTVDFSLNYQLNDNVKIFGYIQNAFDDKYIAARLPSGPRSGAPRMVGVGLEAAF